MHDNIYFTVQHKSIKFSQYVGVVQVEGLTIEILPKIDNDSHSENTWREVLIDMLKATKKIKVKNTGEASVTRQNIHLLDIYFEWFLSEIELLIHQGLIKKYYTQTNQVKALKGKLEFAGHIRKNLIHKERFYTTHQIYNQDHTIHQVLGQAMDIIASLSKGNYLYAKCKRVQINYPEVSTIKCSETLFDKIKLNRKSAPYDTALRIARLIILNYAPNISSGKEQMLALLFNMNSLWEEYVLVCLKKISEERKITVLGQNSKPFWNGITIRPDIVIKHEEDIYVIDTKWKNYKKKRVSTQDLRQMYVYSEYWGAKKTVLLSPSLSTVEPKFIDFEQKKHNTAIGKLSILENDKLDTAIGYKIIDWFLENEKEEPIHKIN